VNIVPKARVVDNADLRSQIAAMNRSNMSSIGINMLRDAVDQEPLDYERRTLLITFLLQAGNAEMAAKEARRAAELMPAKIELRAMAARAWLQAGNAEEAQGDLNEAIARDPEGLETRVLLAEVSLGSGDGKGAIAHLDFALQKGESAELRFKRALANAVVGNLKEADADLLKASPGLATDALAVSTRYRISIHTLSAAIRRHSNDLSALIQRALVQRSNAEVKAEYDRLQIAVLAASSYLDKVGVPERHKNSHERRVLALNLLTQTLSDLGSFLDTGNEDVLTDARINFGEALKQSASAVEGYEAESREPTIDSGTDRL
jgi:tetratricopeptide (TPR) repeat protein